MENDRDKGDRLHGACVALGICERETEMNYRSGGIGIVGVIVIVLVILWLIGVIKLRAWEGSP